MTTGLILVNLRNRCGFTQKEMAEALGIRPTTYAGYEQSKRRPDYHMLRKMSQFFKVSIDYLLCNEWCYEQSSSALEKLLQCPACGDENVHMTSVEINAGGFITRIDHRLPVLSEGKPAGRGTYIEIHYHAECGHSWNRMMFFHKGATWEYLQDIKMNSAEAWAEFTDLWRD